MTLSDYLGSPRVVIDATGLVQERNTYYPSGLQIDAAKLHARHDVFLLPPHRY